MDWFSIVFVVGGILIIVTRVPLLFAPNATLRAYDRLIFATNARLRTFGVGLVILGAALLALPFGAGRLAGFLHLLGWIMAAASLWILIFPDVYRRFGRGVFNFLENSVDDAILRFFGFVAAVAGVALIYVGIYVV